MKKIKSNISKNLKDDLITVPLQQAEEAFPINDFIQTSSKTIDSKRFKKLNLPIHSVIDLGTFSTSYMIEEAQAVFNYYTPINAISWDARSEIEKAKDCCSEFILDLLGASKSKDYKSFTTTGSSEAVFLAVLLLKRYWQSRHQSTKGRLNLIIGSNSHISWIKAAHYLDVDTQIVPLDKKQLTMDFSKLSMLINERTIGVNCTLGAPITLLFDQVHRCNAILEDYYRAYNCFIPLHVDAASGGFVAPFAYPDLNWGFKLKHVLSINISSHKYGLVYPSLGWLLLDDQLYCESLIHENNYLGKPFKTFALHFSHSAAHLFTQYYYVQEFGYDGYKKIITELFELTNKLKHSLVQLEEIDVISSDHPHSLPGVMLKLNSSKTKLGIDALSLALRKKGWKLPCYLLPHPINKQNVGRIVIRYGFTQKLINNLIGDMKEILVKS